MKTLLLRIGLWLTAKCGARFVQRPAPELVTSAHEFAAHVEHQHEPWEWKRRQVLRALMNRYPDARIRDLNLALEIAVQECSASAF